jgi:hypothetical protein
VSALSDAALLARFGWIPDAAAVAVVDDRHRKAAQRAAGGLGDTVAAAQRLRSGEMLSRRQERAGETVEPAQRRTALVQEGPVLPPLTHAQIREALAFPDTPEQAARSPWWPEEAA